MMTQRQCEVLEAVKRYGSAYAAAKMLGVSRQNVAFVLKTVNKTRKSRTTAPRCNRCGIRCQWNLCRRCRKATTTATARRTPRTPPVTPDDDDDDYADRPPPPEPTDWPPGSAGKVEVLAARVAAGVGLWHPDDAKGE